MPILITPYDYQKAVVDSFSRSWKRRPEAAPVATAPTGSGKSVIIGSFCNRVTVAGKRVLNIVPNYELVKQNEKAIRECTNSEVGVFAAQAKRFEGDADIVVGNIDSIWSRLRRRATTLGKIDYIIVDECDLVNKENKGMYREVISIIENAYGSVRVCGVTATPFRTGQGMIIKDSNDDEALFDELTYEITIPQLIQAGKLCNIRSVSVEEKYDISELVKRGEDYTKESLATLSYQKKVTLSSVRESIALAKDRTSCIVFCSGIEHGENILDVLKSEGESAVFPHGGTPTKQRKEMFDGHKSGEFKWLVTCEMATVGYNHPPVDFLALMRPTQSLRLYMQMLGRGMRTSEGKVDCIVADYSFNIDRHGPIDQIEIEKKVKTRKKRQGEVFQPKKKCPKCLFGGVEIHLKKCPMCDYVFESMAIKTETASHGMILSDGVEVVYHDIDMWEAKIHIRLIGKDKLPPGSKAKRVGWAYQDPTATPCVKITYYQKFSYGAKKEIAQEFLHPISKHHKAKKTTFQWAKIILGTNKIETCQDLITAINMADSPDKIATVLKGEHPDVIGYIKGNEFIQRPGSFKPIKQKELFN